MTFVSDDFPEEVAGEPLDSELVEDALDTAKHYLSECVEEGALDESDLEGKTDKELIEMADRLIALGDAAAEARKEEEPTDEELDEIDNN